MAWDWHDLTSGHDLSFMMVPPQSLNDSFGELDGVDLSASSISEAYYSDTRASGRIRYYGDGWRRGSLIRVIDHVGGEDRELGTYVVTDDGGGYSKGSWHTDLTLNGILYMLSTDKLGTPLTVKSGASLVDACRRVITDGLRPAPIVSVSDKRASENIVFEGSKSRLEVVFKLCDMLGARVDVTPRGEITIGRYVEPQSRAALLTLDLNDPRSVAHDDLERKSDYMQLPSMYAVSYKHTESSGGKSVEHEIVGLAWVSHDQWHSAIGPRGYRVTEYETLSDMSPETQERANAIAAERLRARSRENLEWTLTTQALPVHEGDALTLVLPDGDSSLGYTQVHHVFVKSLTLDLGKMSMRVTLKEVTGRDEG